MAPSYWIARSRDFVVNEIDWPGQVDFVSSWNSFFGLGVGMGLDFGLSDLITLTPNTHYFFDPITDADAFLNLSLTITLRPDY